MMGLIFLVPSLSPFASLEKEHQRLCFGETKSKRKNWDKMEKTCYAGIFVYISSFFIFISFLRPNLKHLNTLSF
jgi:hypothetical protein